MKFTGHLLAPNPPNKAINGTPLKESDRLEFIIGVPPLPAGYLPTLPMDSVARYEAPDPATEQKHGARRTTLGGTAYPIILGDPENDKNEYTDAQGKTGSYQTVQLDCAICVVDFNNNVVLTKIQGLPQTIKEFISSGDNDVTITGIYNSTPGIAPMDFIINLNKLFKAPVPIPVHNYYLNSLDITHIVIMPGTQMGQEQGKYSSQTFTIKAITDTPLTDMLP